jgi:ArsR family transcriptional regulator
MKKKNIEEMAQYFKALSNPQRLKLFLMVNDWMDESEVKPKIKSCCCEGVEKAFTKVCEKISLSRSTISHHFNVLENAGLISCIRDGQKYICNINQKAIRAIKNFVK